MSFSASPLQKGGPDKYTLGLHKPIVAHMEVYLQRVHTLDIPFWGLENSLGLGKVSRMLHWNIKDTITASPKTTYDPSFVSINLFLTMGLLNLHFNHEFSLATE